MRPARPSRAEQIALVVLVCAAVAAFGSAYGQPVAWTFWVPCVLSPFWQIGRVPRVVQEGARYATWAFLGLAALLGLIFMAYPVLSQQTATFLTYLAGYGLAFFSALFLLGTAVWPPASTLFPAATGALVVACFNPAAKITPLLVAPGAAAFVYLWLTARAAGGDLWKDLRRNFPRVAASALGTALLAGTIILVLPLLQARVEQAIVWFGSQTTEYSSLSMKSQLGDLQELKLSPKVVMRVWSSRPQKLRGRVFPRFDGQAWYAHPFRGSPLAAAPANLAASAGLTEWLETVPGNLFLVPGTDPRSMAASDSVRTRIVQTVFNTGMLVSPGNTILVRAPLASLRIDPYESLMSPLSAPVQIYAVLNRLEENAEHSGTLPPEMKEELLSLPADTDPRWKDLAARLAEDTRSPEERVAKTVSYVKNAARYSLNVGNFRSRQPVTEFLFEKKAGYCQYFASAAVVLLRLQGVPSRYVTGFNVQEWNRLGGYFLVREADAHAWVEAYLPGKAWVEADPTPDAEFEARRQAMRSDWLAEAREWFTAELAEVWIRLSAGDWGALGRWARDKVRTVLRTVFYERVWVTALVALLTAVLLLAKRRRKMLRHQRAVQFPRGEFSQVPSELTELMAELDALWERRGFARRACSAPLEHLASIPKDRIAPALREAGRKAVECFYQASFGGMHIAPDQVQELQRAVRQEGSAP